MASVEAIFTATGRSNVLQLRHGGVHHFTWHLSGSFVATVSLEVADPGGSNWVVIDADTAEMMRNGQLAGSWDLSLNCTSYTSGAVVAEVKDDTT